MLPSCYRAPILHLKGAEWLPERLAPVGEPAKSTRMAIDSTKLLEVVRAADHPLGVREVMSRMNINPGAMTNVKQMYDEFERLIVAAQIDQDVDSANRTLQLYVAPDMTTAAPDVDPATFDLDTLFGGLP